MDQPFVSPVLVGRAAELQALDRLLSQAAGGRGAAALIAGEAGVGKTRLVGEIVRRATQRACAVLQGQCFEQDRSLPFAPLLDLLRTVFAGRSPQAIAASLGPTAPELVKLLPELAARLPDLAPAPAVEPEQEKRRLFQALTEYFLRQAAQERLLVVVEDLHWSDLVSLEFLLLLARQVASLPVLLLLTYRSDEVQADLRHFLAELDRRRLATEFSPPRLSAGEVDEMIGAILNLGRPAGREFAEVVYPLTEGNPFFVEEMLKALIAGGEIFQGAAGWGRKPLTEMHVPRSVEDAVRRRVDLLSEPARRTLTLAAVAGRRFDLTLLEVVASLTERELLGAIRELVAAQLVVEESSEHFTFRHALTREAVYATLLRRERRRIHLMIAETIEGALAESLGARIADLAYHFFEAEEWAKALDYSRRAGEMAQTLYAPREAAAHFTRALDAARRMLRAPTRPLVRARGQAYETLGDFERALADYQAELEAAQAAADRRGEWQALTDLGFLWASRDYSRMGDYFQRALALARTVDDPSMLAHTLNRVGNWHVNVDRPLEAQSYHQEALGIFRRSDDERGLAETLDLLGMAGYVSGDLVGGTAHYEQAVVLFRKLDERAGLVSSLATMTLRGATYHSATMVSAAALPEAAAAGETARKVAQEIGWRAGEAYALWLLGLCLGAQGEYARALKCAQGGVQIAAEIEHRQWMAAAHCALGALYCDLLALPEAQQHLEQALVLAREVGSLHWLGCTSGHLASTLVLQNELAGAQAVLGTTLAADTPAQTFGQRLAWSARAELALAQGEPSRALQIVEHLIETAVNLSAGRVIPRLWKLQGEALAALNRPDEAEAVWRAAHGIAAEQGAQPLLWRIQAALGKLYRSQARKVEAESAFSAARAMVEKLAAGLTDEAIRDNFLQQALAGLPSAAPVSARQQARPEFAGLTAREREVAARIAAGLSNGEIAEALVVGKRTVETHVGNIMAKLGVDTRAQIIVWAVERGLVYRP